MLIERSELEDKILDETKSIIFKNEKRLEICEHINEKYNIPTGKLTKIITRNVDISEIDIWVLFCLVEELFPTELNKIFTNKEIRLYSTRKYVAPYSISFPYQLKMIQVNNDQWIGAATSKFLIGLFYETKIHYNEKTQRIMTSVKKNGIEYLKPTVNTKSVAEITNSFSKKEFIPNTITLNICENCEDECFEYDEKNSMVILNENIEFDITDGYHRFLAMQKAFYYDESFDYPIEIRICKFSEAKAQQMIYQEDKKTKMKKISSESFNMTSDANKVVERLNDFGSSLSGMIDRNNGLIDYTILSDSININYFKGNKEEEKISYTKVAVELKQKFAITQEKFPNLFTNKISNNIVAGLIYIYRNSNEVEEILSRVEILIEKEGEIYERIGKRINKKLFFEFIDSLMEGA